jgi:hypothetical protein
MATVRSVRLRIVTEIIPPLILNPAKLLITICGFGGEDKYSLKNDQIVTNLERPAQGGSGENEPAQSPKSKE